MRLKDELGNDFSDWEVVNFSKVLSLQGGYAFKSENFQNDGVKVIRISNIPVKGKYVETDGAACHEQIEISGNFLIKKEKH